MRLVCALVVASCFFAACGSESDTAGGASSALDAAGCPIEKPDDGVACETAEKVCEYLEIKNTGDVDCDEVVDAFRCEQGEWVKYDWQCRCPAALPALGADCLGYHAMIYGCEYTLPTACGEQPVYPICGSYTGYTWDYAVTDCPTP